MRNEILGVGFDNLTMAEATAKGQAFLAEAGAHYVVTPNPEIVEICRKNPMAMQAVNGADLVLPDGIGVIYGAKILGKPLKEKIPGIEFGTAMLEYCARSGKRVFLLGAKPGVAEEAARRLREKYPELLICGTGDGYFKDEAAPAQAMREAQTDMALVCLGAPKQELWMRKYGEASGARLLMGLGGSLDVFAGVAQRAPECFVKHDLEWLYRLIRNPSRVGRMSRLPLFLIHVIGGRKR